MALAGKVEVDVVARLDKLDANLREALKRIERFEKKASEGAGVFENRWVQAAVKVRTQLGALELGLGAMNAATQAMNGEWDKFSETVKQLPAGVGPVVRQAEALALVFTGLNKEVEKFEQSQQRAAQHQQQRNQRIGGALALQARLADEINKRTMSSDLARIVGIDQEARNRAAQVEASGLGGEEKQELLQQIEFVRKLKSRELVKDQDQEIADRKAARMRVQEAETAQVNQGFERQQQVLERLRAAELEAEGRHFDARRAMIDADFRQRIQQAQTAGEAEGLARLRGLQLAEVSQQQNDAIASARNQRDALLRQRERALNARRPDDSFRVLTSRSATSNTGSRKQQVEDPQIKKTNEELVKLNEQIRKLSQNTGASFS